MNDAHAEAMRETANHIRVVQGRLFEIVGLILNRARHHDKSKWSEEEWPYFADATANLRGLTYGSPEYQKSMDSLRPAIEHHHSKNAHHPEFHPNGILGMSLIDLIEMLADWKAATERHADGDLASSIRFNIDRFKIPPSIANQLWNTATELGWLGESV